MQQGDQRPSGAQGADDDDTHRRIKQHLADHVGDLAHSVDIINDLALAVEFVRQADYLIISAGAGLSASVGLDYTSEAVFARLYPAMHALGFRCMYQFIGRLPIPEELKWGYLLTHAHRARFTWGPTELYTQLLRLAEQTGQGSDSSGGGGRYFVKTSNADGFFEQSGFDMSRVFTPQGDYGNMQCLSQECNDKAAAASAPVVFPTRPFVDAALPHIDTNETMQITEPSAMPRCPRCSGPVFFNVRGGDWFIESPYHAAGQAYRRFVEQAIAECSRDDDQAEDPDPAPEKERKKSPGTVVILEIGAGFNTPGVLRWPNERLLARHYCVRLVRLNPDYPEVPETSGPLRAVGLPLDAAAVVPLFLKQQQ